jgi:hypothetical protein
MTITFTSGSITTTASEQNLFDITGNAIFMTSIFTHNMASGDTIVIKLYVKDQVSSTMRLFDTQTLTGDQPEDAKYIDAIAARQYRVTIQRTAGTDRTYNWDRVEVT